MRVQDKGYHTPAGDFKPNEYNFLKETMALGDRERNATFSHSPPQANGTQDPPSHLKDVCFKKLTFDEGKSHV